MSDFTLPLRSTLVTGKSESGKSTYAYHYMWNANFLSCRFIFDDFGQCLSRLKIPHASTANELEAALQTRWVNFNPHRIFPGRVEEAFEWFCDWVFNASSRGRGRKCVFVDEIWRFQDREKLPPQLAKLAQMGRSEGIELMTATQLPHKINASLSGNLKEIVCFKIDESRDLRKLADFGMDPEELKNLPVGSFIARNVNSGGIIRHKLFTPRYP